MLTGEYQINKDFDINNLFLNLTFHNTTETFEYKEAILDHPSNYQLVVTKFLSKVNFPLIKLIESKKQGELLDPYVIFDYYVHLGYNYVDSTSRYKTHYNWINQNLFVGRTDRGTAFHYCFDGELPSKMTNRKYIDKDKEIHANKETGTFSRNNVYWKDPATNNAIYSVHEFVQILNDALNTVFYRFQYKIDNDAENHVTKNDPWWTTDVYPNIKNKHVAFFKYENSRLYLYILAYMRGFLASDAGTDNLYNNRRQMELGFSRNLFKYLKGLPLKEINDNGYFYLNVKDFQWNTCRRETLKINEKTGDLYNPYVTVDNEYYVFEGDIVNPVVWSDYIGMAVTAWDFPVKGQICPHFVYTPGLPINRKRYVSKSEEDITRYKIASYAYTFDDSSLILKDEDIQEQNKKSVKDSILFIKYFDPTDNLDHINYENNNVQTALKLDLMRVMPLQKFTLSLWLIDRYNNFEPLTLVRKEFDEVVKMQILFQRIKGTEKENRVVIDKVEVAPKPQQRFISPELLNPPPEQVQEQKEENIVDEDAVMQIIEPVLKKMKQEKEEEEQMKQLLALIVKNEEEEESDDDDEENKNELY